MSANLDLVRSTYAAWERGDFSSTDWANPEIEYVFHGGPEPGRWIGVAQMAKAWFNSLEAWEDYSGVAEEYRELDDGRVLVLTYVSGRGKSSGIEIQQIGGGRGGFSFVYASLGSPSVAWLVVALLYQHRQPSGA